MEQAFSYHRRNGYPAVLGVVLTVIVVETTVVHLLLSAWQLWVAWTLTALGIYSLVWMLRDFRVSQRNPAIVSASGLHLTTGLRWRADLGWEEIVEIRDEPPTEPSVTLTLLGAPDFWLECDGPVVVRGPMGIEREVQFVGVGADDAPAFRRAIQAAIEEKVD